MLPYVDKPLSVGILSFDTGSISLGCCFSIFHYHTGIQEVVYATTFKIQNIIKYRDSIPLTMATTGLQNTDAIFNLVLSLCHNFQPDIVVAEGTYMSRFPQAFASLSLCLNAIERAAYEYDMDVGFATVDPATVKNFNGVKGNSGDKEAIRHSIYANPDILTNVDLTTLDEHAIDSIAIGQGYFRLTLSG